MFGCSTSRLEIRNLMRGREQATLRRPEFAGLVAVALVKNPGIGHGQNAADILGGKIFAFAAILSNSMTPEVMDFRSPVSGCRRAARPLPARRAAESRAPAHSRYPGHIRGWCGRKRTTASARR